jgi:hypothetical protein
MKAENPWGQFFYTGYPDVICVACSAIKHWQAHLADAIGRLHFSNPSKPMNNTNSYL